jgi:hypothetical protein
MLQWAASSAQSMVQCPPGQLSMTQVAPDPQLI